jgi:hypothetical protein
MGSRLLMIIAPHHANRRKTQPPHINKWCERPSFDRTRFASGYANQCLRKSSYRRQRGFLRSKL